MKLLKQPLEKVDEIIKEIRASSSIREVSLSKNIPEKLSNYLTFLYYNIWIFFFFSAQEEPCAAPVLQEKNTRRFNLC